jgi:hypothetical protein
MQNLAESQGADPKRELLRHVVATLAYRGGKVLRNAPSGFAEFRGGEGLRTPGEILAHLGDLLDWAYSITVGQQKYQVSPALAWDEGAQRFFAALKQLDDLLASNQALQAPVEKLFQGPLADALTHIGQLAILRRLAGSAVKGESYYVADIAVGRVGADQAAPKREF